MEARTAPVRRTHPRPISEIDPAEHGRHHGYHRPVPVHQPWGIFVVVGVLVIVILTVIAVRGTFSLSSGSHAPSSTIVGDGAVWTLSPAQYHAVRFSTGENGTLHGNFTSLDAPVNVLLMTGTQYYLFRNNTTEPQSLYATDGVYYGLLSWEVHPPGTYWLVAWNDDPHHAATLTWVSSVRWVAVLA
ncbi:MAG TPA: hypothetical protein VML94_03720 [Thermoplasmata archaeon]|nr:hypothetical protein [Thermoplasmata archaeon]